MLVWLLITQAAIAQAADLDVDPAVVWPAVGCGSLAAVEGVGPDGDAICGGVRLEAMERPVVEDGRSHVGARVQLTPSLSMGRGPLDVGVALPVLDHFGAERGDSDGVGLGDPMLMVRLRPIEQGWARLGLGLDLRVPVGTSERWMSEKGARVRLATSGELGEAKHRGMLAAGLILRPRPLPEPLAQAPWFTGSLAWRALWTEHVHTQIAVHGRGVPSSVRGVEQGPLELRAAVRLGDRSPATTRSASRRRADLRRLRRRGLPA